MVQAYFFPHALLPRVYPGRVEFDVTGTLLSRAGATTGQAVVLADGYLKNSLEWNQDPCIFSAPFGVLHTFCRINRAGGDCRVREASGNWSPSLAQCVSPGDLIIYGKYAPLDKQGPTESIWVDTVLVVDHLRRWDTAPRPSARLCNSLGRCRKRRFVIADPRRFGDDTVSVGADAYQYNLSDAEPDGSHCCTSLQHYQAIVGASRPSVPALRSLRTSFVPLAGPGGTPATVTARDFASTDWGSLQHFIDTRVRPVRGRPFGGWIAEFPDVGLAKKLCKRIIAKSGGIVTIPPLKPTRTASSISIHKNTRSAHARNH
jgi:hypothetical protein